MSLVQGEPEKSEKGAAVMEQVKDSSTPSTIDQSVRIYYASEVAPWAKYMPGPSPQHLYQGFPVSWYRVAVVLLGCFVFFLSGANIAMMGSVSSVPGYLAEVGLTGSDHHTQVLIGVVNSIYWIGVIGGALFSGWLSDKIGRRRAIVTAGIYGIVIIPILVALQNFSWALVLRLLNGVFTGAFDSVGLNLSAESVHHRHRGIAIGAELVCAASGAGLIYFIIYGLSEHTTGDVIWRFPLAFQLVWVFLILSLIYFIPESPRWLTQVGLVDDARNVLLLYEGAEQNHEAGATEAIVEANLTMIQDTIQAEIENASSSTYWDMFTKQDSLKTARRTWSALFIQFGTQAMAGVGIVTGYGIKIFETGGWSSQTAALLSGVGIFTQAVFGIPGALLADKIGRRRAMYYGAGIGAALLMLIGMCGYFVDQNKDTNPARAKSYGTVTVALTLVWCAVFGMTWLWCPFLYPSEIFPASSRSRGSAVGIVGLATGSFFINMVSPFLFQAIGYNVMFFFGGLSLILGTVCFLWMPETAKKTLEDINNLTLEIFDDTNKRQAEFML
ncbi:Low-affinity glucose transporter [Penicillium hispanicum]|uniref:Low-affinity glucose transporter n=1 Tax=Penicillium hispanicum TaxID=1080232 RepID=UPI00254250E8|nr:Low-affinity glucose transporter [Penicillium hispanicum]KAJ5578455.1 Low-affinity glucose transporter [Penicillium hispanicum]